MNETPTSGPIVKSRIHQVREDTSSRHSFSSSQMKGLTAEGAELAEKNVFSALSAFSAVPVLREGKKHLFQVRRRRHHAARRCERREMAERAFATHAPAAQQHE